MELDNNGSVSRLSIPSGFSDATTLFQINKLEKNNTSAPPVGKAIAGDNVFSLIAVKSDNTPVTSFSTPVTFTISYGADIESSYEENTLGLFKYTGSDWEQKSCTVNISSNTITCTLTSFSVYVLIGQSKNNTATSSVLSASTANVCSDSKPEYAPDLFQIDATETTAKVYFSPALNIADYYISYSENSSGEEHGLLVHLGADGVQNFTVERLQPFKKYYFKVRGQRGCMPGDWSSVKSAQTGENVKEAVITNKTIARITHAPTPTIIKPTLPFQAQLNQCQYAVRTGDTLWTIAETLYKDSRKYTELIQDNKETYSNIDSVIRPGWKLSYECNARDKTIAQEQDVKPQSYLLAIKIENDGKPLRNAKIELHSKPQYGTTDDQGIVRFENVEPGNHTVKVAYKTYAAEQKITVDGEDKEIEVSFNVTLKDESVPTTLWVAVISVLLGIILMLIIRLQTKK